MLVDGESGNEQSATCTEYWPATWANTPAYKRHLATHMHPDHGHQDCGLSDQVTRWSGSCVLSPGCWLLLQDTTSRDSMYRA